jgi:hypothetical protein
VTEKLHPTLLSSLVALGSFHDDMLKRSKVVNQLSFVNQKYVAKKKKKKKHNYMHSKI